MDPFNALSTTATVRKIPPLREAPPSNVMSCALVASTDLDRALDTTKEVTEGAGAPSAKMVGQLANSPGRPTMICGHSAPRDEGRSPPVRHGSPCARGRGTHLDRALSPRPTMGKEHRSIMPTHPTTWVLTPRKVIIRCQLVKHDAWVDLNPSCARIRYT
jgi:hypothetical protein